jgi:CRP-like cAMP-binding protein
MFEQGAGGAWRVVPAGHVLEAEGRSHGVHLLDRGALVIHAVSETGQRACLDVLGPGDVAGAARDHIDQDRADHPGRWAHAELGTEVRALVRSRVLSSPALRMARLVERDARAAAALLLMRGRQEARVMRRLAWALTLPVIDRVRATLEDLAIRHGRAVERGQIIDLPLSQDLVASIVGASRESVNRALRELDRHGSVLRVGRAYVVVDPPTRPGP